MYIKPNIDNVIPYQQFVKSTTPFPSHTLPILFAGGRNLALHIRDSGYIDQEQLYTCIDRTTIGETDLNIPTVHFGEKGLDCDVFVLDFGVVIWFNDFGFGIHLVDRNIFYHGLMDVSSTDTTVQGYNMCLILDRHWDAELLNLLIGDCKLFGLQFESSTLSGNRDFSENLYLSFTFVPTVGEFDRHYNAVPESLFFYEWFGINRGDKLVRNIFNAIEKNLEDNDSCSFNMDSANSRQNSYSTVDFSEDVRQQEVLNSLNCGLADDL